MKLFDPSSEVADLLSFFHDRLKVYLRDQGARHDLIDAVITPDSDDLLMIARKVEALSAYINTEEGQNLVAGTKRAVNILNAEEKKGAVVEHVIDVRLFKEPAETALFEAMNEATNEAGNMIEREDFAGAMMALSRLRGPVDAFLDGVLVNDPDAAVKANRLALLGEIRKATQRVADSRRYQADRGLTFDRLAILLLLLAVVPAVRRLERAPSSAFRQLAQAAASAAACQKQELPAASRPDRRLLSLPVQRECPCLAA